MFNMTFDIKMANVKITKLLTRTLIPNLYKVPIRQAYLQKPLEGGDAKNVN